MIVLFAFYPGKPYIFNLLPLLQVNFKNRNENILLSIAFVPNLRFYGIMFLVVEYWTTQIVAIVFIYKKAIYVRDVKYFLPNGCLESLRNGKCNCFHLLLTFTIRSAIASINILVLNKQLEFNISFNFSVR